MDIIAFRQFFIDNFPRTCNLAVSLVKDDEVARDIVQDAFEDLFRSGKSLSQSEMRNYLYMIVRHKCADYYRRLAVHSRYSDYVIQFSESEESWEEHEEKVERVYELIGRMSPKTRQVILGHYIGRLKYRQVAEEMEISESAVKKHLVKGLRFLRKNMMEICILGVTCFEFCTISK